MKEERVLKIQSILIGFSCALAFLLPNTWYSVGIGWLSAILLCHVLVRSNGAYKYPYIAMVVAHGIAIYWLIETIHTFGNFPFWLSVIIFTLFCFTNSLYILVASFIFKHLPTQFHKWSLAAPIGVAVAEFLSIRIFPWHFGLTQIKFLPFVQIADIGGPVLVSFLMIWIASALERSLRDRVISKSALIALGFGGVSIIYGFARIQQFASPVGPTHKVSIIQGNIPIFDKHAPELYRANIGTYSSLGEAYHVRDNLIIWPETAIMSPLPADNIAGMSLPFLSPTPKWLVGAMTLGGKNDVYNSAVAIDTDANVLDIYHKIILMPFGEYVPFSKTFPWLLDAAHMAGEISPGDGIKILKYPASDSAPELRVAALICYEDVVSDLSRRAVAQGANLLINLTNDAWFGDTVAPLQHNLLASFRAIENRRYLIRAANTGLSSIINPLGETTSILQPFSQGVLSTLVEPLEYTSPYSQLFGNSINWGLSLIGLVFAGHGFRKRKELARSLIQK
jgi:apolipoprotein N-acyltransferase